MLGDKFVIISLSVDEFTEATLGTYALNVVSRDGGTTVQVPDIRVTSRGNSYLLGDAENTSLLVTVRADITGLRSDPDSPIPGTDTGCLSADTTVKIICDNIAFPVADVEFLRDGTVIDAGADEEDR